MKKTFILLISLFFISIKVNAEALTETAQAAVLIEPTTNRLLYDLNKDEQRPPASMTKMMTLLLIFEAIDSNKISLDDMVPISKNAANMGGSQVFLEENSEIKASELIKSIAIASGNDAAVAMAEYVGGTLEEFVSMMNKKVEELDLKNTHFVNVHGLDAENHYSSAYDMSQIALELLKHEKILEFTSLYEDYLNKPDGTKTWLVNTNKLVRFYKGVDGLKTGYTAPAGFCLTATAKRNNIRLISVVMGSDSSEHRSSDTTALLNYGFSTYKLNTILNKEQIVDNVKVKGAKIDNVDIVAKEDITDLIKQNEDKTYENKITIDNLKAPINVGDVVGKLEVFDNNSIKIGEVDLTVKEKVEKQNFFDLYYKIFKKVIGS